MPAAQRRDGLAEIDPDLLAPPVTSTARARSSGQQAIARIVRNASYAMSRFSVAAFRRLPRRRWMVDHAAEQSRRECL